MFRARLLWLILAFVTLLAYAPVRQNGFINYDDPDYLTENPVVQAGLTWTGIGWAFTTWHASNWHPITWLAHMLDCQLFGLDPAAHHLINVLLHAANAVLLFFLVFRMTANHWAAWLTAAFFAWHPLHVQSVAWASERKDVLCTLFGLLAIGEYLRQARSPQPKAQPSESRILTSQTLFRHLRSKTALLSLCLFAFGLMAKPMLVTLPFVLLLLDFWPLARCRSSSTNGPRMTWLNLVVEKWPYFLLTAASCIVTFLAQRTEAVVALEPYPLPLRLGNAVLSYARYLSLMFWPMDLAVIYPLPQQVNWASVALASLLLAVLSWFAWAQRRERPHLLVGWLWYLGTLIPVIGIVQVGGQAMADRYTYLPLIGIFMALSLEFTAWARRLKIPWAVSSSIACVALVACLIGTAYQLRFWKNGETLFARAVAVTPANAIAHLNLGTAYEQHGRRDDALGEYRRALAINPSLAQAHNNVANLLDQAGQSQAALGHYREAVRLKPRAPLAHANLGTMLSRLGRFDDARVELLEAARLAPADSRPYYLMGKALLREGRAADALGSFREALRRDPNDVQSLIYAARVLSASPEPGARDGLAAITYAERAASLLGEAQPLVLDTLAMACAEAGQFAKATAALRRAIDLARSAGDEQNLAVLRQRLRLYETGQPYREDAKSMADPGAGSP